VDLRILLAPDKFKATLDAPSVAAAMARGIRHALPSAETRLHPLADGGEGSLDCIASSAGGRFSAIAAEDAFGAPVHARLLDSGERVMIAMHETARLPARPTPAGALRATSRGTGRALVEARRLFPGREIVVWVGGSASTDGGAGAAQAAGWRLLDARGRHLGPGGAALRGLRRIEPPDEPFAASVAGACDVDSPLLGANGAAAAFSPQKGAGADEVRILEDGLATLAERFRADLGIDVAGAPHGGAGGGMGAGLVAFFRAALGSGFDRVAAETRLYDAIDGSDLVVTGEGRVDAATLRGKVTGNVARICSSRGTPCVVVAGDVGLPVDRSAQEMLGVAAVVSLVDVCGRRAAFADPEECVRTATARVVGRLRSEG
jgi:glycerate kinase